MYPSRKTLVVWMCACLTGLIHVEDARASLLLVSSRAALGGDDLVDWGTAPSGPLPNPFSMTSLGGLPVTVQLFAPSPIGMAIGTSSGAPGDFPLGSHYITGAGSSGGTFFGGVRTLELRFGQAVRGFGADIDPTFTQVTISNSVSIEAFDAAGKTVGRHSIQIVDPAQNSQPFFMGGLSDEVNITRVRFQVVSFDGAIGRFGNAFGNVNEVSLVSPSSVSAVPEPAGLVLLALGGLGLLGCTYRRRAVGPV